MTTRRKLLALGLLPLLCSGGLALKVGLMEHRVGGGISAVNDGDADRARTAFAANASLNAFEPWIAPYDEGVAAYLQGDPEAAVALFTAALADVPAAEECRVRTNLALATEAVGDEAAEGARLRWFEARKTIASCLENETAAAVDDRLERKLADAAAALEAAVADPDRPELPEREPADEEDLTAAEQQELLDQLNAEGRRTRERDRERERRQQRQDEAEETEEPPTYNW